jgi:hypothetical protein
MNFLYKGKITKTALEAKMSDLLEDPKHKNTEWTCSPYVEEGKKLSLYYFDGVHIGTWVGGSGWIFDGKGA